MNDERVFHILKSPHISEKAALLGDSANQHVFKVATDAKKPEIKAAVEQLFGVKVAEVRTVNVNGKSKRMGARKGSRKDWIDRRIENHGTHQSKTYFTRTPLRSFG